MADPIGTGTTTAATTALTGATLAGLVSGIDPGVIIAAFAGSVIFVLSAVDFPIWQRLFLFIVAMALGIYGADFVASIITSVLTALPGPNQITASPPVGAAVSSAASVRVLMAISKRPGESWLGRFRSSKREDE